MINISLLILSIQVDLVGGVKLMSMSINFGLRMLAATTYGVTQALLGDELAWLFVQGGWLVAVMLLVCGVTLGYVALRLLRRYYEAIIPVILMVVIVALILVGIGQLIN